MALAVIFVVRPYGAGMTLITCFECTAVDVTYPSSFHETCWTHASTGLFHALLKLRLEKGIRYSVTPASVLEMSCWKSGG